MFDEILTEEEISKAEYSAKLAELEPELFYLEWKAREAKVPTLILLDGLVGTYIGDAIRTLTERLDPRSLRVYPFRAPSPREQRLPWLYRYWMKLPNTGEMTIFDSSWYHETIALFARKQIKTKELAARFAEINQLEQMLLDDGHVFLKLWFHIDRKEQTRRLKKADKETDDFWDVTEEEWEQNENYKAWRKAALEILTATHNERAPWLIFNATTPRRNRLKMFEVIIGAMKAKLHQVAPALHSGPAPKTTENGISDKAAQPKEENRL